MSGGRVVPDVLAAVDLGSNSFHMVVARYSHGQLVILDRLREMVRLAAGLGDSGRLDDTATERALRCLERFGQRLRAMRADSVRVVGTNALRRAKRKRWFLERARAALGHPIEIISGLEEARLIYSGVAHTSPMSPDKRLVIDIGGGSTEVVIGEGFDPLAAREPVRGLRRFEREFVSTTAGFPRSAWSGRARRSGWNSSRCRRLIGRWAGCRPSAVPARCASSAMCCTA